MIIVPGAAGEIGVLARHAPLIATLKAGSTRVYLTRDDEQRRVDRRGVGEQPVAKLLGGLPAFLFDDPRLGPADLVAPLVDLQREPLAVPGQSREGHPMAGAWHELVVVGEPYRLADRLNDLGGLVQKVLEAQGQEAPGRRAVLECEPRRVAPVL